MFYIVLIVLTLNFPKSIKKIPFNLNKNSLWISYPLNNDYLDDISKMIPNTHKLSKFKIFNEDKYEYKLLFNFFNVNTPFNSGDRLEIVTVANNIINNDKSFIVIDCFTNTLNWDPINGIQFKNTFINKNINNVNYSFTVKNKNNFCNFNGKFTNIYLNPLYEFCIDYNKICYFNKFNTGFKLEFNNNDIHKYVRKLDNIEIENNIYSKYLLKHTHVFSFLDSMKFNVILY